MVRLVVADDHPVYRQGLVAALRDREDLEVVAEAGDGEQALALVAEHGPDVLLLDLRMPGVDGLGVLARLAEADAPVRVLVLAASADTEIVYRAVEAGAAGFLSKDAGAQEILEAVRTVAAGGTALGASVQGGLVEAVRRRRVPEGPPLSPRELEVLKLVAGGASTPEAGRRLGLSPATVKTHLGRVFEKLGVSDRSSAVAEGMRRGLLS